MQLRRLGVPPLWLVVLILGSWLSADPPVFAQQPSPRPKSVSRELPSAVSGALRELKERPRVPKEPSATIEVEPAPKPAIGQAPGLKIEVKAFRFSGLTAVREQRLQRVVRKYLGPARSFDDLQAAVGEVAEYLRAAGFFLAQAYLPAQQVKDGVIEIAVLEGRIGQVKVEREGDVPVSQRAVDSVLSVLKPGMVIREGEIERSLFLLGDLRGFQVRSVMQPGEKPGTADLVVTLSPARRLEAAVDYDNFGSPFTGQNRAGGTFSWNNPLHLGDSLSARTVFSFNGGLAFGRAAYLLPIGPYGTKLGAAYSRLNYELGTSVFEPLGLHGSAEVVSGYVLHPLARGRNLNLFLTLGYDHRELEDTNDQFSQTGIRRMNVGTLSLVGDSRDLFLGGGINNFSLSYTTGWLDFDRSFQRQVDASRIGHKTSGNYHKLNAAFSRLQQIGGPFLGFIAMSGQWASKNLDPIEKISLGGPNTVRAYLEGEGVSDEALLITTELRYAIPQPEVFRLPGDLIGAAFVDVGFGNIHKDPLATDKPKTITRSGAGLGLTWGRPDDFLVRSSVAWRLTEAPIDGTGDRVPQFFIQVQKSF
jgi:hemolysin activation/secretion protein